MKTFTKQNPVHILIAVLVAGLFFSAGYAFGHFHERFGDDYRPGSIHPNAPLQDGSGMGRWNANATTSAPAGAVNETAQ